MGRSPSAPGTPRGAASGASDDSNEDEEMVGVGKGTAPGTPVAGRGLVLGQRVKKDKGRDPVYTSFQLC